MYRLFLVLVWAGLFFGVPFLAIAAVKEGIVPDFRGPDAVLGWAIYEVCCFVLAVWFWGFGKEQVRFREFETKVKYYIRKHAAEDPNAPSQQICDAAGAQASAEMMAKYGLSFRKMSRIIRLGRRLHLSTLKKYP